MDRETPETPTREDRPDNRGPRSRRALLVGLVVVVAAGVIAAGLVVWGQRAAEDAVDAPPEEVVPPEGPVPEATPDEPAASPFEELTWSPPDVADAEHLEITEPGTYDLHADVSYVIEAPQRIDGAVHLRGGGDLVWIGGHIHIPDQGDGPVSPDDRRGLMITDIDDRRGDPSRYGASPPDRVVHIEGLLIDGPDVAEGVNTNAPGAIVQLQNIHVADIHFRSADDRDGTDGWRTNHPDVIQTWGSQAELRVDGVTGSSAYQGIFLKEDHADRALGPMWLRRVDVTAIQHEGTDGVTYTGHRMFTYYPESIGDLHLDSGTIFVQHHPDSGWNREQPNPTEETAYWRHRFRDETTGELVDEPPPGDAEFTDALGNPHPDLTGEDEVGEWAGWSDGPLDWDGEEPARIHSGSPPDGPFVPAEHVGPDYVSPGYLDGD